MFILALILIILAASDGVYTLDAIEKYGIHVEMNPVIRKFGVWLGIIPPTMGLIGLAYWLHSVPLMTFLIGFRVKVLLNQIMSQRLRGRIESHPPSLVDLSTRPL